MKKLLSALAALVMLLSCLMAPAALADDKISVVTTIFPIYDWVREVAGNNLSNMDLTMLLDNGVDLHSYQPTAQDILKVSTADLFIYVGGESDEWVEDVLEAAPNADVRTINLVEAMGEDIKMEELVEGMEHVHEHEEEEHAHEEHEHEEIEEEDIQDRPLADFAGDWKSLAPLAESGELDAYLQHEAEEHGESLEKVRAEQVEKWACDAVSVKIEGNTITFTAADGAVCAAAYTFAGYTPVLADDGDIKAVRYNYTTDSADAPKYVQFNDHGYQPAAAEHFHFYMGSEGFEALMNAASNSFFVPADWSAAEIMTELAGHGGHDHDHEHEHEEEEEEADEHVWLSLRNAEKLVKVIADTLAEIDATNADAYQANAAAYIEKLAALDGEYQKAVDLANVNTVLFGDRFPFRYMVDDYGLSYYAAFSGCSAESEASFATVVFLAQKVNELNLPAVLTIEGANHRIAETVVATSDAKAAKILSMDSLQSTTSADVKNGVTYLSVMESNLAVLKEALGL